MSDIRAALEALKRCELAIAESMKCGGNTDWSHFLPWLRERVAEAESAPAGAALESAGEPAPGQGQAETEVSLPVFPAPVDGAVEMCDYCKPWPDAAIRHAKHLAYLWATSKRDSQRWQDLYEATETAIDALTSPATQPKGEPAALTDLEQKWLMRDPVALAQLMLREDIAYSEASSQLEPDELSGWPTARWTQLYERGRSIIAEDLEVWDAEILKTFGFPAILAERAPAEAQPAALTDEVRARELATLKRWHEAIYAGNELTVADEIDGIIRAATPAPAESPEPVAVGEVPSGVLGYVYRRNGATYSCLLDPRPFKNTDASPIEWFTAVGATPPAASAVEPVGPEVFLLEAQKWTGDHRTAVWIALVEVAASLGVTITKEQCHDRSVEAEVRAKGRSA